MGTDLVSYKGDGDRLLLLTVAIILLQSHASPLLVLALLYAAM